MGTWVKLTTKTGKNDDGLTWLMLNQAFPVVGDKNNDLNNEDWTKILSSQSFSGDPRRILKQEQPDEALLSQVAQTSDQCHPSLNEMRQQAAPSLWMNPIMVRLC